MTRLSPAIMQIIGFALIDLRFQYWAVLKYTSGWSKDEILAWMQTFGEVGSTTNEIIGTIYGFRSHFGPLGTFRFDADGQLFVHLGRREQAD